jgi:membrane protein YqaA with SNARE-associated domain
MSFFSKGDAFLYRLSKTRHLSVVMFLVAFFEATISPLFPEAFILLVLIYRKDISWKILSVISALGSATGSLVMYLIGARLYTVYGSQVVAFLHGEDIEGRAKILFTDNAFLAQFLAAVTPFPDRIFSFLAGAFFISPAIIFAATFLGRFFRIVPVAYLSYKYGDIARLYVKNNGKKVSISVSLATLFYVFYRMLF